MTGLARKWNNHRTMVKGRRAVDRAIIGANAETVRMELLAIASRNNQSPLL